MKSTWNDTPFKSLIDALAWAKSQSIRVEDVPEGKVPEGFFAVKIGGYIVAQKIEGGPVKQLVPKKPQGTPDRYTGPTLDVSRRLVSGIIHHEDPNALATLRTKLDKAGNVTWRSVEAEVAFVRYGPSRNELFIYWRDDKGGWFSCVVYPPLYTDSPELQPEYYTSKPKMLGGE